MPEAGRRVKCSETHQHFASHLLSSHADSLRRASDSTHIYLPFILLCIFFVLWPSLKGYLSEGSSACSSLCPTYQVCRSHDIRSVLPSAAVNIQPSGFMSRLNGLVLIPLGYHQEHREPEDRPWHQTLKLIPHAWVLFNINSIRYR